MSLGKRIVSHGFKIRLFDGTNLVKCNMYHGFKENYEGFTRLLFPTFDYRILYYSWVWYWLVFSALYPMILFIVSFFTLDFLVMGLSAISIGIMAFLSLASLSRLKFPLKLTLLYPLTITFLSFIAFRSMFTTLGKKIEWKGRKTPGYKVRWV